MYLNFNSSCVGGIPRRKHCAGAAGLIIIPLFYFVLPQDMSSVAKCVLNVPEKKLLFDIFFFFFILSKPLSASGCAYIC